MGHYWVEIPFLGEDRTIRPSDFDLDLAEGPVPLVVNVISQDVIAAGELLDLLDMLFIIVDVAEILSPRGARDLLERGRPVELQVAEIGRAHV